MQARLPKIELPEIPNIPEGVTLHELIQQSRIEAKQTVEGISLLLQISTEYYEQIEAGEVFPEQELLKRICSLFGWNYHELLQREKRSQLRQTTACSYISGFFRFIHNRNKTQGNSGGNCSKLAANIQRTTGNNANSFGIG